MCTGTYFLYMVANGFLSEYCNRAGSEVTNNVGDAFTTSECSNLNTRHNCTLYTALVPRNLFTIVGIQVSSACYKWWCVSNPTIQFLVKNANILFIFKDGCQQDGCSVPDVLPSLKATWSLRGFLLQNHVIWYKLYLL